MAAKFISYLRVSTAKQGHSGLGVEAQRKAVLDFLNGGNWKLVAEFVEIESGKKSDRPKLAEALAACRLHGATLVVSRLDRLTRDAHFLLGLQKSGVEFQAVDVPSATNLTIGILACVAQEEARLVSLRTIAALKAARARGVKLGNPKNLTNAARRKGSRLGAMTRTANANQRAKDLQPVIESIRAAGVQSLAGIAAELNARGIATARGKSFSAAQVLSVVNRLRTLR